MTSRPLLPRPASRHQGGCQAARPARQGTNRVLVVAGCALGAVFVAAVVLGYELRDYLLLLAVATVPAVVYWASLRRHPYRACRACGESGTVRGRVFREARAFCAPCGGTGLVPRFGTRFLSPGHRPANRKGAVR
jgi:hypothetical protein